MTLFIFGALTTTPGTSQVAAINHDPDAARLVTSDIPNFWRVFDRASLTSAADLFQREYLDAGSLGLRDFTRSRIQTGRGLAATVAARPRYYAAIRENTMALDTTPGVRESIRKAFRGLKALSPESVFPDVYFLIGRLNSAGTTSSNGLLIGLEMNARDPGTPVDELSNWERAVTGQIATLPHIVAHEHSCSQSDRRPDARSQVLRKGADLSELVSAGPSIGATPTATRMSGLGGFSAVMHGTDTSNRPFRCALPTVRPIWILHWLQNPETFYQRANQSLMRCDRSFRLPMLPRSFGRAIFWWRAIGPLTDKPACPPSSGIMSPRRAAICHVSRHPELSPSVQRNWGRSHGFVWRETRS